MIAESKRPLEEGVRQVVPIHNPITTPMKKANLEWVNIPKQALFTRSIKSCHLTSTQLEVMFSSISTPFKSSTSRFQSQLRFCLNLWKASSLSSMRQFRALTQSTTSAKRWEKICFFTAEVLWKSISFQSSLNLCLKCMPTDMNQMICSLPSVLSKSKPRSPNKSWNTSESIKSSLLRPKH